MTNSSKQANTFKALSTVAFVIASSLVLNNFSSADVEIFTNQEQIKGTATEVAFEIPVAPKAAIQGVHMLTERAVKLYQPTLTTEAVLRTTEMLHKNTWQRLSTEPSLAINDIIEVKDAVAVEASTINSTQIGDEIEMTLPGDMQYIVVVDNKSTNSWSGYVQGFDSQYPVLFTTSNDSVFGTITTPEGSYTLEAINGEGWVYQNPEISSLSHDGAEDFMHPSHNHHNEA